MTLIERAGLAALHRLDPERAHDWSLRALAAGKHVICEKPLGRDAEESYEIWRQVAATGVKHMTAFNYRFYPAIVLAKQLIEAGEIGGQVEVMAREGGHAEGGGHEGG